MPGVSVCTRKRAQVLLQGTAADDLPVALLVPWQAKQDVVAQRGGHDPRLLWTVAQLAAKPDLATHALDLTKQCLAQRRFATANGAADSHQLTTRDGQVDVLQRERLGRRSAGSFFTSRPWEGAPR